MSKRHLLLLPVAVTIVGFFSLHGLHMGPASMHHGSTEVQKASKVNTESTRTASPQISQVSEQQPATQAGVQAVAQKQEQTDAAHSASKQPDTQQKTEPAKPAQAVSVGKYLETQRRHPNALPELAALSDTDPAAHCPLAKGNWCGPYWTQKPQPAKPPPRGDKECPDNCNGVGWCDYDTGRCHCRAGWMGVGCKEPIKRACYNMGPDKRDKDIFGSYWIHTRCSGICDDDVGMCYCPPETKYGRRMDPNAPPGSKPLQEGRPMFWCQPNTTADGKAIKWTWNIHRHEDVLGPEGWCNADNPTKRRCECFNDGIAGPTCEQRTEHICMNQCTGHGECIHGYCSCYPGWYGHDCSRKKKGLPLEKGDHEGETPVKPWLKDITRRVPAAEDPPTRPARKRPYIYVYDLDPAYHAHIMQYRIEGAHCTNRLFMPWGPTGNTSTWVGYYAYAIETVFHELMLTSEHRTFDPEEADFFYVPMYPACLHDIVGKASRPFWPIDEDGAGRWNHRPYASSNMLRAAKEWIRYNHPYWDRYGGRDHIFLLSHDEAPCYAPKDIWDSVILSHWGRMDFPHGSNTSYGADNYSMEMTHHTMPKGWLHETSAAHPCHDPSKHLVVPVFKPPTHYSHSMYLGGEQRERDILALFRGDMGLTRHGCIYSRCIRQRLWKLYKEGEWRRKHNILYGDHGEVAGDYSQLLSRSKFCLVIPGDGWSARYEDASTHGCIPVIIMDNTLGPFESLIDYSTFSLRVRESDLHRLVDILTAVTPERLAQMQAALTTAWMRFRWNGLPLGERDVANIMQENKNAQGGQLKAIMGMQWAQTADDDAFSTVIQWLYSRMGAVRSQPASKPATA